MNIEKEINDSVWSPVFDSVETPLLDLCWDSVSGSAWGSVWGSVQNSVQRTVHRIVRNTIDNTIGEYEYWK
jgi:hypothetical protein